MKKVWQSKVIWVNGLTLAGAGVGWMAGTLTSYPELVAGLVITQALINILLRFVTTTQVVT